MVLLTLSPGLANKQTSKKKYIEVEQTSNARVIEKEKLSYMIDVDVIKNIFI